MSSSESKKEVINSPVLFDKSDLVGSRETFIDNYFQAYFTFGTGPSSIIIPKKIEYLKDCGWRMYCQIPSKWEPRVVVEESVNDLIFITPQKEVFVVPVVLPTTDAKVCMGFILGSPARLLGK